MHSTKCLHTICRTCEVKSDLLINATTRHDKYPEKTLQDLLSELAKIDLSSEEYAETMPQQLCSNCANKLKNAYDFVVQAQQVNQRLLDSFANGNKDMQDCLLEAPIDMASHDFLDIKMEVDANAEDAPLFPANIADETENSLEAKGDDQCGITKDEYQNIGADDDGNDEWRLSDASVGSGGAVADDNLKEERKSSSLGSDTDNQVLAMRKLKKKKVTRSKRKSSESKVHKFDSEDDDDFVPVKRKRGRPSTNKCKANQEGRFECDLCPKTFAWQKDMQRHTLSHSSETSYTCNICDRGFQRKDKYVDHMRKHNALGKNLKIKRRTNFCERLYSGLRFKLLECRLCSLRCATIPVLLDHLAVHKSDVGALEALTPENIVVKEFFGGAADFDLAKIKASIREDLNAQTFNKYCLLLNEYGYEMSVDDTDEDEKSVIAKTDTVVKYVCELCGYNFSRKRQMFAHVQEKHKQDALPYRCNVCKLFFVSEQLFEQHTRTQCRNREKKYKCRRCPGKFMWAENLEQHQCADKMKKRAAKNDAKQCKTTSKLEIESELESEQLAKSSRYLCCLCTARFENLQTLRAHLMIHEDGHTEVDMLNGAYFKHYYPAGCIGQESELTLQIAADFATQDFARFYAALDEYGQELDLYDSESATDDDDDEAEDSGIPPKTMYTCCICNAKSQRRKHLLQHQNEEHTTQQDQSDCMGFQCDKCNKRYVCAELLEQHQLRDCLNRHKTIQCEQCEDRFVWQENYKMHLNIRHTAQGGKTKSKLVKKLQCDLCDKVFIWPKDLTRHRRIHLPDTEKYECPYCDRKFVRKDNMQSHLKVHGEEAKRSKPMRVKGVDQQLCKPHGCKRIECMICHTNHRKISDLRTHLSTHQYTVRFSVSGAGGGCGGFEDAEDIEAISKALYPEEEQNLDEKSLTKRIMLDISNREFDRFYSITNEAGFELNLDSSETETDSETEMVDQSANTNKNAKYFCELCSNGFQRKFQLYAHQQAKHQWEQAGYACSICHARFISATLLEHHSRTLCHNVQKRYICRKCPQRFRWKENFKAHGSTHASEVGDGKQQPTTFECLECNRSFQMQKDLTRHMLMHSRDSAIFACHWCPRKFYRHQNMVQHLERHGIAHHELTYAEMLINVHKFANGKKSIQCKICNIDFERITDLRTHLLSAPELHHSYDSMLNYSITNQLGYELHLEDSETDVETKPDNVPLTYTCELCQLVCRRKHELFRHQQAMHKLEKIILKCTHCVFKSVSKDILAYHMRTQCENKEKQFVCQKCNLKFMWSHNLAQHVELQHNENVSEAPAAVLLETLTPDAKQVFQCPHCKCKYNRKDRLTAHIKKMHGVAGADSASPSRKTAAQANAEDKLKKADQKRFLCAFCGKAVSSSSNLIIHMRRHTGEKPFKCDFCEMAFARSSDMQCHRRKHTGERPYQCTVCEKAFSRSYKLHQHMRIHNGERPYKCTYCEKSFTQSNDLTLHVRRHTGERPYVCGVCGERFIQGTALKNHRLMRGHFEEIDEPPVRRTILEQFPAS